MIRVVHSRVGGPVAAAMVALAAFAGWAVDRTAFNAHGPVSPEQRVVHVGGHRLVARVLVRTRKLLTAAGRSQVVMERVAGAPLPASCGPARVLGPEPPVCSVRLERPRGRAPPVGSA